MSPRIRPSGVGPFFTLQVAGLWLPTQAQWTGTPMGIHRDGRDAVSRAWSLLCLKVQFEDGRTELTREQGDSLSDCCHRRVRVQMFALAIVFLSPFRTQMLSRTFENRIGSFALSLVSSGVDCRKQTI